MQKLHLVGFTTDQQGLILSARRGARSGSFHLPLDEALAEAVEELRARQAEEAEAAEEHEPDPPRVESRLPVREIQARLRQGRTVADVAKAAGVDVAWVERFATPVFAEQAQVIQKVQRMPLRRARLGPSSHGIGDAVRRNLADRGVALSPEEFADGWTTRQLAHGRW
ncbi:MAG: septation protein SepH, partial [Acidimicrobiales bacterium]